MSPFIVSAINDTDTFRVMYGWKSGKKSGHYLIPAGYRGPKSGRPGSGAVIKKLSGLILGKKVQVASVREYRGPAIVCDIYYNGKNIIEYMNEAA